MNGTAADTLAVSPPPLRNLCDGHGRLDPRAVGWSARPRVLCHIPGHFGRRKRWNHWCIVSPGWMLSLTIADLDYLTYGAAYFLDLDSGQAVAHTQIRFFGLGYQLPDEPQASHAFEHPRLQLRFDEQPGRLRVTGQAPDLGGLPLELALEVRRPSHLESVNLVVPMGEHTFHACSRQLGLPISGCLQLGRRRYDCQAGQSFAALDFGRGVWPLHTYWTRAAFAAPGGIAGNFGTGWTEASDLRENALWFGGKLSRVLDDVHIREPRDPLAEWRLDSACGRVELLFRPEQLHQARPSVGLFYANTRQWFGRFNGTLRHDDGDCVPVDGALGWIGSTRARW